MIMANMANTQYYDKLQEDLKKLKESDKERKNGKKNIEYIEKAATRRSTYARRATSLKIASMELEIQTHCGINLEIIPSWQNGKTHKYNSIKTTPIIAELAEVEEEVGPTGAATQPLLVDQVTASSAKRKVGPTLKAIVPTAKPKVNKKACRVCSISKETSFWLGCGYRNPRSKRQDCCYWVHQKCIGLFYKNKEDLSKVPFYCAKHGR